VPANSGLTYAFCARPFACSGCDMNLHDAIAKFSKKLVKTTHHGNPTVDV
jgi:hypothetical protein